MPQLNYTGVTDIAVGQGTKATSLPMAPPSDYYAPAAEVRTATLQSAAAAPGIGTAIDVSGMASLVVGLTGTFVGTVTWQYSLDSTNGTDGTWATLPGGQTLTTGALNAGTSTAPIVLAFRVLGLKMVRANITAYTSGAITVIARAQANDGAMLQTPVVLYPAGSTTAMSTMNNADALNGATIQSAGVWGWNGASADRLRTPNVFKVVALTAATAETAIWTPTSGKKFRFMGFVLTCGAASTLTFKDGTGLATVFAARAATDQPISPNGMGNGILSGAADRLLTVTRGTSATLDGVVFGTEE